jgi:hypothetical protein
MAESSIQLNASQKKEIEEKLLASDFTQRLHDYYNGLNPYEPYIDDIIRYIYFELIVPYFDDIIFMPQDAVDFIDTRFQSGLINSLAMNCSINNMIGEIAADNPEDRTNPAYVKKPSVIIDELEKFAVDKYEVHLLMIQTSKLYSQKSNVKQFDNLAFSDNDWEDLYRDAFDGNPDAEWNID